jgi:hypothetical protein
MFYAFILIILPAIVTFLIVYITQSQTFRKNLIREEFDDDYYEISSKLGKCSRYEGMKAIVTFREKWIYIVDLQTLSDACDALTNQLKGNMNGTTG